MRKSQLYYVLAIVFLLNSGISAQMDSEVQRAMKTITADDIKAELTFLSSDYLEGRETASRGLELAAEYIASLYKMWGIEKAGDKISVREGNRRIQEETFFQFIDMIEYTQGDVNYITVYSKDKNSGAVIANKFDFQTDFSVYFTENALVKAPVIFAGYGLKKPELEFNEYSEVDVRGKIIVVFSGIPGGSDTTSVVYKKFKDIYNDRTAYNQIRETYKNEGALAVLRMNPPLNNVISPTRNWAQNVMLYKPDWYESNEPLPPRRRFKLVDAPYETDVPIFTVSDRLAEVLFKNTGFCPLEAQKKIDSGGVPYSKELDNVQVEFKTTVNTKIMKTANVVGYIEGNDPELKKELIVIGAHYDHLGKLGGYIFNGADDNASGTVGVMEVAKAFASMKTKPKRSVLFAAWTGEEKGLLGSKFFVDHPFVPVEDIVLNINMDMIGRNSDNKEENKNQAFCTVSVEAPELQSMVENNNNFIGLDLQVRRRHITRGGSDHVPFALKNRPVMSFSCGGHPDYHRPSDSAEKINFEKMEKVIRLVFLNAWEMANRKDRLTWEPVKDETSRPGVTKSAAIPPPPKRKTLQQIGDTRATQLYAHGFENLPYKEKMLAFYLYLAGLPGRDIFTDQNHRYALKIRNIIEGIYTHPEGIDSDVYEKIKIYTHRFWLNSCHYRLGQKDKFIPDCTYEEFVEAAKTAHENGAHFNLKGESLEKTLEMLKPHIFDKDYEPYITSKNPPPGEDILTYSSNNFYEGVTFDEVNKWAEAGNEKNSLNSKVMKENGRIVEKVYRAGYPERGIPPGMYDKELSISVKYLNKALEYADAEQKEVIEALIKYLKTGDLDDFDDYNIKWVKTDPVVDFILGFIEYYMDSRGKKGSFENFVFFKDLEAAKFYKQLAEYAPYFEEKAPWLDKYKKEKFGNPPVANDILVVHAAGDGGPGTPIGINLPNAQWIREQYGSKNVMLANMMEGSYKGAPVEPLEEPNDLMKEFYHPEHIEFLKTVDGNVGYLMTTLHEIIGHGSGKASEQLTGDPADHLKEFYNTLEEARADLMAYYNLHDPVLRELGAVYSEKAADNVYWTKARNTLLRYTYNAYRGAETVEQDHERGRFLICNYLWKKCGAITVDRIDGKLYAKPTSIEKMREGFGELLAEIQRIKAEGDYEAAKNLVQTYGIYLDKDIHKEMTERMDAYRKAQAEKNNREEPVNPVNHRGISMPVLKPVYDSRGNIIDIKIEYWEDFAREQLYYSSYLWNIY